MATETTLTTTFALDDEIPISQRQAMGKILQAGGITVANDALMRGAFPLVLRSMDSRLRGRAFSATTVQVPTGRFLLITFLGMTSNIADYQAKIVPADGPNAGANLNLVAAGISTALSQPAMLLLGAGDKITVPRHLGVMGMEFTAPAGVTRILRTVDSGSAYTVGVGKRFDLLAAFCTDSGGGTNQITIDGTTGVTVTNSQGQAVTSVWLTGLPFKAGQVIGGVGTTDILISGIEYTAV